MDYAARHLYTRGRLARVRTIHFARWVFLDGRKRVVFCSNYDGSLESYMDDFINKVGFGLNVVFSNGIGYPRTNWLVLRRLRATSEVQGVPAPPPDADPGLVQGLSRPDRGRPGAQRPHPRRDSSAVVERRRGARMGGAAMNAQCDVDYGDIQGLVRFGYGG